MAFNGALSLTMKIQMSDSTNLNMDSEHTASRKREFPGSEFPESHELHHGDEMEIVDDFTDDAGTIERTVKRQRKDHCTPGSMCESSDLKIQASPELRAHNLEDVPEIESGDKPDEAYPAQKETPAEGEVSPAGTTSAGLARFLEEFRAEQKESHELEGTWWTYNEDLVDKVKEAYAQGYTVQDMVLNQWVRAAKALSVSQDGHSHREDNGHAASLEARRRYQRDLIEEDDDPDAIWGPQMAKLLKLLNLNI
ncbi:hypothetical protein ABW21_db0209392 [Orbilia brochopaga]|nr:hypothetical protein ABW21_db0209392 [Drechslerella brochopaga]